jgi:hypothetical protein
MILTSCGGDGGGSGDESTGKAADTGATITMWTRSATEAASRALRG